MNSDVEALLKANLAPRCGARSKRTALGWRGNGLQFGIPPTNEYFYGLLLICEKGATGLGHINS